MEVEIKPECNLTDEARQRAIKNIQAWHQPMNPVSIIDLVTEMRLKTSSKKMSQDDLIAQAKLYARDLMPFPASVVEHVLKTQPNISEWWPEWKPLLVRIESYCRKNKLTLEALKNYKKPSLENKSPEEKDFKRIDEIMANYRKTVGLEE